MDWLSNFDERELKEIKFCLLYKHQFGHGTMGHNLRIIVAKMAHILENAESIINEKPERAPLPEGIDRELLDR
jgi:hypothetical protein